MIYIALISVELFVPDWAEENKAEADANLAKDIYYNDEDEVCCFPTHETKLVSAKKMARAVCYCGRSKCALVYCDSGTVRVEL